nr:site-specific integrase [Armatimonadota bacterium]
MLKDPSSCAALAPPVSPELSLELSDLAELSREYISQSRAANTLRAYRADWADFEGWCTGHGRAALPADAETVALYLSDRAQSHKTSTLSRRLTGISQAHAAAGFDSPTKAAAVRAVWQGIQRKHGTA